MKNLATIGILAVLGMVILKKKTPQTIVLPKAIVAIDTIK
jgi:hypothetical protein